MKPDSVGESVPGAESEAGAEVVQVEPARQDEIDFLNPPAGIGGYEKFKKEREEWNLREGERHGLPLGKQVEVDLGLGRKAKGRLFIDETSQLLEPDARDPMLRVGNRVFRLSEVEGFVRLD